MSTWLFEAVDAGACQPSSASLAAYSSAVSDPGALAYCNLLLLLTHWCKGTRILECDDHKNAFLLACLDSKLSRQALQTVCHGFKHIYSLPALVVIVLNSGLLVACFEW